MTARILIGFTVVLLLSSCGVTPSNYAVNNPKFEFSDFFNGRLCAWGLVRDRSTEMTRKFVVRIDAKTEAEQTELLEWFKFSDNQIQKRVWKFTQKEGRLIGTAGDVVGSAQGKVWGDSLHLEYVLSLQVDDDNWEINMDDWLHLIDENTLLGSTQMSKLGIDLGRIDISIQKRLDDDKCSISDEEILSFQADNE